MHHVTPLIGIVVAGLVVAFFAGAVAHRLRLSPIAGYLVAGVLVGPFTPGFVADANLATELAEIGVILLMFGVGLHFSLRDLLAVRKVALPGALVQIAVATGLSMGLAAWMGWTVLAGAVFGLALSVASTVVLLRALQARDLVETERGRIAVGWLIVEDLAMVLALVLLPAIVSVQNSPDGAGGQQVLQSIGTVALKVTGFFALMLVVGRRVIPRVLHWVVHTGSRELFRLAVLAIALGVAFGAALVFDVSFALGAFFAGMILGETQLSRRAAEETLPLRDAFAVLFFVSVGMLFDPKVVIEQPVPLIATVAIIVLGKSLAAFWIVRAFGHDNRTALTISASLAQIGEFSFILAGLGSNLGVLPDDARDLILASAILSILLNPLVFTLIVKKGRSAAPEADEGVPPPCTKRHVVLVGYGRVGRLLAPKMRDGGYRVVVVEDQSDIVAKAKEDGFDTVRGDATERSVLERAELGTASTLLLAIPEGFEAGVIAQRARVAHSTLRIVARAHSEEEVAHLERHGADQVVMGEREIAIRMAALAGGENSALRA